jgi:signal transduction histidine kinase
MKGYAYLLRKRFIKASDEQAAQLASRMEQQITKLTGLVDDFLDVTRLVGGTLQFREEYFDFDELVTEIVQELQLVNEHVNIHQEGEAHQQICGDRMRIGQVLTNLLTNAMKYAPQSAYILVKTFTNESEVTLCVQDFGPGIPRELHTKIFDSFYRIEKNEQRETPGLGLGLHISSEIIKRQDGQIWVESEEGQGASFFFTLPLVRKLVPEPQNSL